MSLGKVESMLKAVPGITVRKGRRFKLGMSQQHILSILQCKLCMPFCLCYVCAGERKLMYDILLMQSCVVFAKSDMTYCCCVVSQPEQGWKGAKEQMGSDEDLAKAIFKELSSKKLARLEIPTKVTVYMPFCSYPYLHDTLYPLLSFFTTLAILS